jgi:butyryl-CoA dehydrogenase
MPYQPPLDDMIRTLRDAAGLDEAIAQGHLGDFDDSLIEPVAQEAARVASDLIAPLNRDGDRIGATFANGAVTTPPGWSAAYRAWREGGWNGLSVPEEFGGQGLPLSLNALCFDMWSAASLSFSLCPLLTLGAIDAISHHGSPAIKQLYLPRLISGEWTGTMLLTEPQAGSDVGALRTRADRHDDGTYRIKGSKIFITYGEHDMAENIVHLVLARLPDAPAGTRGISLFLVPKFLPDANDALGARNDIRASGIEHKLGIHGSPTCMMSLGDDEGAIGYLIGEENRGMACMFTMMNQARLGVGLEGVGIADRATQQALIYAQERQQGRAISSTANASDAIIAHPDVQRMLMQMHALTAAARAICYATALAIDVSHRASSPEVASQAAARAALLTPLAKAFSTDIANEVTSLGVQVHGGMGYIEETGAAQHFRDARITAIYEGTNGIQAIDLVMRKLAADKGEAMLALIHDLEAIATQAGQSDHAPLKALAAPMHDAIKHLKQASLRMIETLNRDPSAALAGASDFLRLASLVTGGALLTKSALKAFAREGEVPASLKAFALAQFFVTHIMVFVAALAACASAPMPSAASRDALLNSN